MVAVLLCQGGTTHRVAQLQPGVAAFFLRLKLSDIRAGMMQVTSPVLSRPGADCACVQTLSPLPVQ